MRWSCGGRDRSNIRFEAPFMAGGSALRRGIESSDRREPFMAESREQAAGGAARIENARGSRRQSTRKIGRDGRESSGVVRRNAAARRRRRVIILRPFAIETVVIALRRRRIGINKSAAAADNDVVLAGQRIAVWNDEPLVMANRSSRRTAWAASPMRYMAELCCAIHESLGRKLLVWKSWHPKSRVRQTDFPKTIGECGKSLRAEALPR